MPIDILVITAHPDDAELAASGTIINQIALGNSVVLLELTAGELGTRGNAQIREKEALIAAEIMGVEHRENLNMQDGFFQNTNENKIKIIEKIRFYKPKIVITNAPTDRHPDHGRASLLVEEACFLSGLRKIETSLNGTSQPAFRPKMVLKAIQDYYLEPNFIVDISKSYRKKIEAIKAFQSQFYNPNSNEPESPISSKEFMRFIEARALQFGRLIQAEYGEGFVMSRPPGIKDVNDLL